MIKIPNEDRVINAKYGYYDGNKYLFTHRDPQTGELFGDNIPVGKNPTTYGKWVSGDSVRIIWEDGESAKVLEKPKQATKKNRSKKPKKNQENKE